MYLLITELMEDFEGTFIVRRRITEGLLSVIFEKNRFFESFF
jgi:hypothetical protein